MTEGKTPPDRTIEQAAVIAACNSKARESGKVAVDYTEIRNVRKHPAVTIFPKENRHLWSK